jgi:hypothetical protein
MQDLELALGRVTTVCTGIEPSTGSKKPPGLRGSVDDQEAGTRPHPVYAAGLPGCPAGSYDPGLDISGLGGFGPGM